MTATVDDDIASDGLVCDCSCRCRWPVDKAGEVCNACTEGLHVDDEWYQEPDKWDEEDYRITDEIERGWE